MRTTQREARLNAAHDSESDSASLVARIAHWALAVRTDDVPAAALHQAKLLVLDTIGCGVAALDEPVPQAVLDVVREYGGTPRCTLIGNAERTSVSNAVLANGVLMRALDLNDYVDRDHPSDNIPAALAVGEMQNSRAGDLLAAIVVGYEIYGRCKHLIKLDSPWDGTTISGIAAAVMAGRLLQMETPALSHGLALSLARSATSALARFGAISSLKALANPLVAQNAVQAILLASRGVTGPLALFESRRGMSSVFTESDAFAELTRPFPAETYILHANVKPYPCLVTGQAAVAAALLLHQRIGGEVDRLDSLRIVMADVPAVRIQQEDRGRWDPQTREAADHCFQFLVAVTLIDGAFGLRQFEGEYGMTRVCAR
jgi:2-methylcitrate dehydratase